MITGVTAASLLAAAAMTFIPGGALREIVRFAAGLMMTIALLTPLAHLQLLPLRQLAQQSDASISQSISSAAKQRQEGIQQASAQEIRAYILGRLREHGISASVAVMMEAQADGTLSTAAVTLSELSADAAQAAQILEQECGIAKEKQVYVPTKSP